MEPRPTDQLTERQKAILRRVSEGLGSKAIARDLGVSPHTVDGHARDALRTLGVSDRKEAARMLAAAERSPPQSLSDQSLSIGDPPFESILDVAPAAGRSGGEEDGIQVMEERFPSPWPERPDDNRRAGGQRRNQLGMFQRLARIGRIAAAVVGAFASLAFALFLMQRLFQAFSFP